MKADNGGGEDSVHLLLQAFCLSLSLLLLVSSSNLRLLVHSLSLCVYSFDLTSAYVGGVGLV